MIRNVLVHIINLIKNICVIFKKTRFVELRNVRLFIDAVLWPSDLYKVLISYKNTFGSFPNLMFPKKFNEYLQKSKLFNRKEIQTKLADKFLVREYIASTIGEQYLNKIYWEGDSLSDAPRDKLPSEFVIKTNQGSGTNIIVRDLSSFDWQRAIIQTNIWMAHNHSVHFAEWQYRWIKPRVIIEKLLLTNDGALPIDYKFFCFNGNVGLVQVDFERQKSHKRLLFDRSFEVLPLEYQYQKYKGNFNKPRCFEEMIRLSEELAKPHKFVRVDFYDHNGPVFGEITFHPEAGLGRFQPELWDFELGKLMAQKTDFLDR